MRLREWLGRAVLATGFSFSLLLIGAVLIAAAAGGLRGFDPGMLLRMPSVLYGRTGLLPQILNTAVLCLLSLSAALPIGFGCAVLLLRAGDSPAAGILSAALGALSSVPTAVYGLFGLLAFSQGLGLRYSILSGVLTAALLILPTAAKTACRAMEGLAHSCLPSARALGATEAECYCGIILPAARRGLASAALLCAARVAGESAALLLTSGIGNAAPPLDPRGWGNYLLSSGATLAVGIYQALLEGENDAAFAAALVLLLLLLLLGRAARMLGGKQDANQDNS